MKKVLLFAAVAVFGLFSVNAQDDQSSNGFANGDFFVTGSLGFGSEKTGDFKDSSFSFSPKAGLFISDNIAVGVALGLGARTVEEPGNEDTDITAFEAGVFGRYYISPANKFSFFGELGANVVSSKVEQGSFEREDDGFSIGFAPGISYFVSKNIVLEASIGILNYTTTEPDFDGAESTDTFNFGIDLTDVNFGITVKL